MPLIKSASRAAVSQNIRQLRSDKYPQNQAVAIALDVARRSKRRAEGGRAEFETALSPEQESAFHVWKNLNAPADSGADYDLRGAFKGGLSPAENGHWPDTFKKPNHPTFSNESIYATERPDLAGRWNGEQYMPPVVVQAERAGMKRGGALDVAYRVKREGRAMGGIPPTPWQVRNEARAMTHSGPIMSAVPGRTDNHPMSVAPGSYIVNADTVSHIGQNNTNAGHAVLSQMFGRGGPFGTPPARIARGRGAPPAPKPMRADGGPADGDGPVDILAAGGEFVVEPDIVANIGGGDLKRGHEILDYWMKQQRKDHIKTLRSLPGPAKD
jgi:hypothetical protein